jgi:hypothetical protein
MGLHLMIKHEKSLPICGNASVCCAPDGSGRGQFEAVDPLLASGCFVGIADASSLPISGADTAWDNRSPSSLHLSSRSPCAMRGWNVSICAGSLMRRFVVLRQLRRREAIRRRCYDIPHERLGENEDPSRSHRFGVESSCESDRPASGPDNRPSSPPWRCL